MALWQPPRPSVRVTNVCTRCLYLTFRHYSEAPRAPPLLLKLRGDLKSAMREKDSSRLAVLRGLLADVTNASKTQSPVKTDMQVLSLLRKRSAQSKAASAEFESAGRADLKEKEDKEASVLEEYAGGVQMVGEEEVKKALQEARMALEKDGARVDKGSVLRKLIGPQGVLVEKNVDKAMVARIVNSGLGSGTN